MCVLVKAQFNAMKALVKQLLHLIKSSVNFRELFVYLRERPIYPRELFVHTIKSTLDLGGKRSIRYFSLIHKFLLHHKRVWMCSILLRAPFSQQHKVPLPKTEQLIGGKADLRPLRLFPAVPDCEVRR